jgi:uncharacterized membrane protein
MSELLVFTYENETGAKQLEATLIDWQARPGARIEDAAAVIRRSDGRMHAEHASKLVGDGLLGGMFWGVLIGALLWARWWGLSIGGAVGEIGLDDDFVRDVGESVGRGHSALFLLAQDKQAEAIILLGQESGARILRASLSPENERRLWDVFGASDK